jgi:hypothetical protein
MGKKLRATLLTMVLLGCGGRSNNPTANGFINQTQHTDAELWTIWSAAQQSVSRNIDLNPLQQSASGAAAKILPGDPRALSIMPQQLDVAPEPDVSSAVLFAATGIRRADPTGMIACPAPCNVQYTTAYSRFRPEITRYAASWEWTSSFSPLLQYEFENQILFALGYDMTWR